MSASPLHQDMPNALAWEQEKPHKNHMPYFLLMKMRNLNGEAMEQLFGLN